MKRLNILLTGMYTLILFGVVAFAACHKPKPSCYSEELKKQYADVMCTMDCPGVIGCDGKTYCNECEAARQGIRVK